MTFLAPGFFLASLIVAAAVVALHFIVTRQPRAAVLPTARFVPDLPASATARATRPSDLLLLLLRLLLVLAAGAGLARPVIKPSRGAEARVILADVSRAVGNASELRDSAMALYRDGDALIVFDSAARPAHGADVQSAISPSSARGNLSSALIAALRAGSALRDAADSLELVIVSPFAADESDAATDSIRALWPGKARLVRAGVGVDSSEPERHALEIDTELTDPLAITVSLARRNAGAAGAIRRNAESAVGSGEIVGQGRAVIEWPIASRPRAAVPRTLRDTTGGVVAGDDVVIAPFERRWSFANDSIRGGEVVARWVDGDPAAVEWPAGRGCVRSVAIPVPATGDLAIQEDFVRLVGALAGPCVLRRSSAPMSAAALANLAGRGGLAPRQGFRPRSDLESWLAPWLLGLALLASVAELLLRRRPNGVKLESASVRRAA